MLAVLAMPAQAQIVSSTDIKTAKGAFYLSVDDHATIFVNGQKVFHANIGESRSSEMELKVGDHVVAQLKNDGGPRRFKLLFASSDGRNVVSFRSTDWRIVLDLAVTDFTPAEMQQWQKRPKQIPGGKGLPIKSYSDWVWGDLESSILAAIVTPQMFSAKPQ